MLQETFQDFLTFSIMYWIPLGPSTSFLQIIVYLNGGII